MRELARLLRAPQRITVLLGGGLPVALFFGMVLFLDGAASPAEAVAAPSEVSSSSSSTSSGTLMCAPGWTLVGTRCRTVSFGIEVLWRDAIYCQAGTQPNIAHTRCVRIPVSVPSIPNFRLPSGGTVNTTFPAATNGYPPYTYSVSGLPPGITFSSSTRGASGTLPTVTVDTTYTVIYTARDSRSGRASTSFTAVIYPPASTPTPTPDPTPTPTPTPTPAPTPTPDPTPSGSSGETYSLRLSESAQVSITLTDMTIDFDCQVGTSTCTNGGGTQDDSWSGTLAVGTHEIRVYPSVTGSTGNYTLKVSASRSGGSSSGTITRTKTLVDVDKAGVSSQQSHSFTLAASGDVSVALTDMTINFDCRVGRGRCTNLSGTLDDSWSGTMRAGTYSVMVWPYETGPGDYSLLVTSTETVTFVATPLGGATAVTFCEEDEEGNAIEDTCQQVSFGEEITVTGVDPGPDPGPPPGTRPGEGDPGPGPTPNPGPSPNPTPTTNTSDVIGSLKNVVETTKLDCKGLNIDLGDRFEAPRPGGRKHSGIDIQTKGQRSNFFAPVSGTLSYHDQQVRNPRTGELEYSGCGHYARITRADGSWATICHLDPAHDVDPGPVAAGALIGRDGQTGSGTGPHLHLGYRSANGTALNPFSLWGGEAAAGGDGFTFEDSDPTTCEEPEE